MAQTQKLDWQAVDTDAFKGDMRAKWQAYVKAQKAAKDAWNAFFAIAQPKAQEMAPEGTDAILTYKFGKLSLAFGEPKAKKTTASKDAVTL